MPISPVPLILSVPSESSDHVSASPNSPPATGSVSARTVIPPKKRAVTTTISAMGALHTFFALIIISNCNLEMIPISYENAYLTILF